MKKLILLATLTFTTYTQGIHAAPISLGSYAFDDAATINSLTSFSNLSSSNGSLSAITDLDASTFIYGSSTNTTATAQLGFGSNLYNGENDDLVLYFLGAGDDITPYTFDITIGNKTSSYTANLDTFVDTNGATKKYQIAVAGGFADLLTATINLDTFNIGSNDFISSLNISNIGPHNRLALGAGFYTTPVPVPAALYLFISGIMGLSLIRRRKRT